MASDNDKPMTIVISGSFRKHYENIRTVIKEFEDLGVKVLSPEHSDVVNPGAPFVVLTTDEVTCPKTLENQHLRAISRADALYLYDPDGYIGLSSAMEVGWALAFHKPVYFREGAEDSTLQHFASKIATPKEIAIELSAMHKNMAGTLNAQSSLEMLQEYVRQATDARGFDSETPRDKVLLMLEEFGELARALRKLIGLKIDKAKTQSNTDLQYELADILFYLLDLANVCGIHLFEAFQAKERQNGHREWQKP